MLKPVNNLYINETDGCDSDEQHKSAHVQAHLPHGWSCCLGQHRRPVSPNLALDAVHVLACKMTCSAQSMRK